MEWVSWKGCHRVHAPLLDSTVRLPWICDVQHQVCTLRYGIENGNGTRNLPAVECRRGASRDVDHTGWPHSAGCTPPMANIRLYVEWPHNFNTTARPGGGNEVWKIHTPLTTPHPTGGYQRGGSFHV